MTLSGSRRAGPYSRAADHIFTRSGVPVIRNRRRGTIADVLVALREVGAITLVEDLLRHRYAQFATASTASLIKIWSYFHEETFGHEQPPLPMLPITVKSMVIIGVLFEAGGYRSYPTYVSVIKGAHIEEGHDWDQLLQHMSAWVTRSIFRGIGPARQSCNFSFEKLSVLPRRLTPLVDQCPQKPVPLALPSRIFLRREVEAIIAMVSAWTFSDDPQELVWL